MYLAAGRLASGLNSSPTTQTTPPTKGRFVSATKLDTGHCMSLAPKENPRSICQDVEEIEKRLGGVKLSFDEKWELALTNSSRFNNFRSDTQTSGHPSGGCRACHCGHCLTVGCVGSATLPFWGVFLESGSTTKVPQQMLLSWSGPTELSDVTQYQVMMRLMLGGLLCTSIGCALLTATWKDSVAGPIGAGMTRKIGST